MRPVPIPLLAKLLLFISLMMISQGTRSQNYTMGYEEFISWDEFVTEYFNDVEFSLAKGINDNWQSEALENLENLHNHPVNINTATREELLLIPILKEAQVDSILAYRDKNHLFRSLGELLWVNELPRFTRQHLSLFAFAGDTIQKIIPISKRFYQGKHEIASRVDLPLYKRKGNSDFTQEELDKNPSSYYLGNLIANTIRYRYQWHKDLAYGITLQKDSGEPFAACHNYPYDYNSFYFFIRSKSKRYSVWLGDYNVNIGEGLMLGSAFFNGPLQIVENTTFLSKTIRPHTSSDEINYFRGLATSINLGKTFQFTSFLSFRKLDGKTSNDTVVSIKKDGQHRSLTEISNRRTFNNYIMGSRLTYTDAKKQIGINGYWSHYGHTIYPPIKKYNRHYFRGKDAIGISTDYLWHTRRWQIQGESSLDKRMHFATSNMVRFTPNSRSSFILHERSFSQKNMAPLGYTMQEASQLQNEHAIMLGATCQLFRKISLVSYIDYFYHPSPTYSASQPSHGLNFFILGKYQVTNTFSMRLQYKMKTEEKNVKGHNNLLQYVTTNRGRLTGIICTPRINLNFAADFSAVFRQTAPTTYGWMFSTRNNMAITPKISIHTFASLFFTDDYATRLYAYEPQLQYAASFPTFAYHGTRIAGVFQWKFLPKAYVALRYAWIRYFNRDHIGSGPQQINAPSKNDLSIQTGWRF